MKKRMLLILTVGVSIAPCVFAGGSIAKVELPHAGQDKTPPLESVLCKVNPEKTLVGESSSGGSQSQTATAASAR